MADARDLRDVVDEQGKHIDEVQSKVVDIRHDLANHQQKVEYQLQLLEQNNTARHTKLAESFNELKSGLKWGLGLLVSVILSFMGWALLQQYNANESQKKDMQQQIQLLQAQEQTRSQYRQDVLSRLPPGASQPANSPAGQ